MADTQMQVGDANTVRTSLENVRNLPVFIPPVDICESENEVVVLADMPGVPMENVEIDLHGDQLTIKGRVTAAYGNGEQGRVIWREWQEGDYFRRFTITSNVDREKIEAKMKDGVLKLVLPKAQAAKPRKIEIEHLN